MAILKIKLYPNPILKAQAEPIVKITSSEEQLIDDMWETMLAAKGLGLAAPQVGKSLRIALVRLSQEEEKDDYLPLINPEIICKEGEVIAEEGCLSIVEYTAPIKRAQKVKVRYQDKKGIWQEYLAEDFLARAFQHEIDHLNGLLFIDYLSKLKRGFVKNRLRKRQTASP